jgi:hypothetical protein
VRATNTSSATIKKQYRAAFAESCSHLEFEGEVALALTISQRAPHHIDDRDDGFKSAIAKAQKVAIW